MAILKKQSWRRLRKENLPVTVFFIITIISVALIILPMWNYVSFYSALGKLDVYISEVTLSTSQINIISSAQARVNLTILAINPTGYSGLQVSSVLCALYYIGPVYQVSGYEGRQSSSDLWLLTTARTSQWYPIAPNSNATIPFAFSFNTNNGNPNNQAAYNFISYLESGPTSIEWLVICNVFLSSFLTNPEISNSTIYYTAAS